MDNETRYPLWAYAAVGIAALLVLLWIVRAVLGAIAGLINLAIIVVVAMAVIGWAVNRQNDRS